MKILHICTSDSGGAGLCCLRIHKALMTQGIESKVLTLHKTSTNVSNVYEYKRGRSKLFFWRAINKLIRIAHLKITDYNRAILLSKKNKAVSTLPVSLFDISNDPLVKWADVIHLHWVDNFIDYPSFFKNVKKPIAWTLHDEGLFCGVFHYITENNSNELEKKYYNIKYKSIHEAKSLGIVFLSNMMYNQFRNDKMISGRRMTVINNPVDYTEFYPHERNEVRRKYNIPKDCLVFSFAANSISVPRKGLSILSKAIQTMNISNVWIIAIGGTEKYEGIPLVHPLGILTSTEAMSEAYSCADYFVMPSKKEAFAQTPIESMACGVPAIVFPVSGTEELITKQNGVRANGFTSEDLEDAIRQAMTTKYDSYVIRQDMIDRFSPKIIAMKYIDFYKDLLSDFISKE